MIVSQQTYNTSDPTVDSQIVSLKAAGADVLLIFSVPKFAAQAIRKAYDIDWHPQEFVVQRRLLDCGSDQARRLRGAPRASSRRPTRRTRPIRNGATIRR